MRRAKDGLETGGTKGGRMTPGRRLGHGDSSHMPKFQFWHGMLVQMVGILKSMTCIQMAGILKSMTWHNRAAFKWQRVSPINHVTVLFPYMEVRNFGRKNIKPCSWNETSFRAFFEK
jgi:hypothetical protein